MVAGASGRPYRRIATEEAWISAELLALYQKILKEGSSNDPGFDSLWRHYGLGMSERCVAVRERMLDLGERRIGDVDAAGIDMQLLLLTTPGVQLLDTRSVVGADRVLYAMDYPYQYVPEEVDAMERMPLTDQDKKAFFQTNAESVFRL